MAQNVASVDCELAHVGGAALAHLHHETEHGLLLLLCGCCCCVGVMQLLLFYDDSLA